MQNENNILRVTGWKTKKVQGGYFFEVSTSDYQQPKVVHYSGIKATRAQAASFAKKCVRYINQVRGQ